MIQNNTARKLMYEWHSGQTCPLYAAASSGLCASFDALLYACNGIAEPDKSKLIEWIKHRQEMQRYDVIVRGTGYAILPWVSKA